MSDNNKYDGMPFHEFPIQSEGLKVGLRDYFAGQALAGILADPERHGFNESHAECEFFVAEDAYILADAMIVLRERERA